MKKLISFLLAAVMFAYVSYIGVRAEILFTDPFDVKTDYWIYAGNMFKISDVNGNHMLEGKSNSRVHQGHYTPSKEGVGYGAGNGTITTGTFWVELYTELKDNKNAGAGLWWKNTYHQKHEGADIADTFTLKYYPATSKVIFRRDYPGATTDEERIITTYEDPHQIGENMKSMTPVTLGMRVEPGRISAFANGKCIGTFYDATIGIDPCPVLLWNDGLHVYYDNYNLGDLDELLIPSIVPGDADWEYKIANGKVTITKYLGSDTVVEIPAYLSLNKYPVTAINDNAFANCSATSIIIPDSVTEIGTKAFYGCSALTNVSIPDGITSISRYMFEGCTSLTSITIPNSVTSIGDVAFSSCTSLSSITIPDSVTSIGNYAFTYCSSLKTVYYSGSEEDWKKIAIDDNNDPLFNANIIFNSSGPSAEPGDANGDGKINAKDIIAVMRAMLGNPPEGFSFKAADMDQNGRINARDVIAIMRTMLEK